MSRASAGGARRGGRAALVVLAALGLAGLLVLGAGVVVLRHFRGGADYAGPGEGSAVVQVNPGDSATRIGEELVAAGVVRSVGAFRAAADADSRSAGLEPGTYRLRHGMSARSALALMLDPSSRLVGHVVLPEGLSLRDALQRISSAAQIPLGDLQAAAAQPQSLGLPPYAGGLEGYLFPATYDFQPHTTATAALRTMVSRFATAAGDVGLTEGAQALGRSAADVVVVASLLEKEAKQPADFPKVARVVYNRLAANMPLQLDSTVNYALAKRSGHLSDRQTRTASPYNTYLHPGLPPGPIDAPGEVALRAALHPATGDWLYFITVDKAGNSAFTHSYQDFLRLKAKAQRDGVY